MREQRTFTIPNKGDIHEVADELDVLLGLGYTYVAGFPCGSGWLVILGRLVDKPKAKASIHW